MQVRLAAIASVFLVCAWIGCHAALTPEELRGKQIYTLGTSARGGELSAVVGKEAVALPASAAPCSSCHGPDGQGRPEGGVLPPDIRWSELSKVYGHVHPDGRQHPAFDEPTLVRVILAGIDPAGNRLDRVMPIYRMSEDDMADLVAYLKHLDKEQDPGVEKDRIQVATLLPLNGPQGELGQAMAQVLHAYFQKLNTQGGIYGRRLELLVIPFGESPEGTLENLHLAIEQEGIFAIVSAYTAGMDEELLDLLREGGVPLVGPFTLDPGDEISNTATFYIYPGFVEQARVLADAAFQNMTDDGISVMLAGPRDRLVDRLMMASVEQLQVHIDTEPEIVRYSPGEIAAKKVADRVATSGHDTLVFFGDQAELNTLLAEFATRQQNPRVYLLSSSISRPLFDVPTSFHKRIFLAYPTLDSDLTDAGRTEYWQLAHEHALPPDHIQGQIAAFAAAKLLVEGIRRAGRGLSRNGLVEALEGLYGFETGFTPPLSFGPNRRIGARGAHVITVDLARKTYQSVGGWRELP